MKSLRDTEMFPDGVGVAVNREMVVWDRVDYDDTFTKIVNVWTGWKFISDDALCWDYACEIPQAKTVTMTSFDIAMLPRGTGFVDNIMKRTVYNVSIAEDTCGHILLAGSYLTDYSGYILPGETEVRPFSYVNKI